MPNELKKVKVEFISLVGPGKYPKNGKGIVFKAGEAVQAVMAKADAVKHLIYAVVYEPDAPDSEGDQASAETIEEMAHRFLLEYRQSAIDFNHNQNARGAVVVESFILREADPNFPDAKIGSWCVVIKVYDIEVWAMVEAGEILGVSFSGEALRSPISKSQDASAIERILIKLLSAIGITKAADLPTTNEEQEAMPITEEDKKAIQASIEGALKPLAEKVEAIEKALPAAPPAPAAPVEKAAPADSELEALKKSNAEMADRLAVIEKAGVGRQSADGSEPSKEKAGPAIF